MMEVVELQVQLVLLGYLQSCKVLLSCKENWICSHSTWSKLCHNHHTSHKVFMNCTVSQVYEWPLSSLLPHLFCPSMSFAVLVWFHLHLGSLLPYFLPPLPFPLWLVFHAFRMVMRPFCLVPGFQPSSKGVQDYCVLALLFWMLWIKFSFTHCCLYYSDNSDSQVPTCDKSFHNYFLHNNCVPAITIHITVFGIMTPTTDVHFMGLSKILFISVYILVTSKHVMYIV